MLVREHLEEILSRRYEDASQDLLDKVRGLVESVLPSLTSEEAERLTERFRWSFNLDEQASVAFATAKSVKPASLEEIVSGSWFGDYLEYTKEAESPAAFHFGAALSMVAAGLGRRPLIRWDAARLYPNMYVLLIGSTASKKSTAIRKAAQIVGTVMEPAMLPNEGTHQGFAHALKRQYEANGVAEGYIVVSELAAMMKQDHNTKRLVQWLTDWYDCDDSWKRALRGEEVYELNNVCVNFLGASQMPWMRDLPPEAITAGYLPRHLIFATDERRPRRAFPRFDEKLRAKLMSHLGEIRRTVTPEVVEFTKEALEYITRWYEIELSHQFAMTDNEQFAAWLDRKQSHLMKIAVVWQYTDSGLANGVGIEATHKAREIVDWCDESVRQVYGTLGVSSEGQAADDVMKLLGRHRGELRQSRIIRTLRNKYRASQIKEALDTLDKAKEVVKVADPVHGVVWRTRE